jgi:cell wall-associated NlpC family hydrolase
VKTFDHRRTPARPDLAAEHLRGLVTAKKYVSGRRMRVGGELADLMSAPRTSASRETQALHGEELVAYEIANDWAFLQLAGDDYVGYVRAAELHELDGEPTHLVQATRTFVYEAESIKTPVLCALPMASTLRCAARRGAFLERAQGGFVYAEHLVETGSHDADFVAVAERFLNAPYLWGGKSWLGIDCSGLVQLALARAGVRAPRDTDMLEAEFGVPHDFPGQPLERGDLVFWKGHVAIMQDEKRILHANGAYMAVVSEPLHEAIARIEAAGGGRITSVRRMAT